MDIYCGYIFIYNNGHMLSYKIDFDIRGHGNIPYNNMQISPFYYRSKYINSIKEIYNSNTKDLYTAVPLDKNGNYNIITLDKVIKNTDEESSYVTTADRSISENLFLYARGFSYFNPHKLRSTIYVIDAKSILPNDDNVNTYIYQNKINNLKKSEFTELDRGREIACIVYGQLYNFTRIYSSNNIIKSKFSSDNIIGVVIMPFKLAWVLASKK